MIKSTYKSGIEYLEHESKLKIFNTINDLNRMKESIENDISKDTEILDDINSRIARCEKSVTRK